MIVITLKLTTKYTIMKSRLKLASIIFFIFYVTTSNGQADLINDEFPEAQQEVLETFGAIAQSIKDGDMDKLISCL